uniref:Transmembrane protein 198 n=2 Tax=Eptatretus burgeri TaxID=7764 RepID=A0A8C4QHJ3_EPTBU
MMCAMRTKGALLGLSTPCRPRVDGLVGVRYNCSCQTLCSLFPTVWTIISLSDQVKLWMHRGMLATCACANELFLASLLGKHPYWRRAIGIRRKHGGNKQKPKMKSSGGIWIGFAFQLLLLYPQTHPGTAKCLCEKGPGTLGRLLRPVLPSIPYTMTAVPHAVSLHAITTELPIPTEGPDPCTVEIERTYDALPSAVAAVCCLFGIVYCFFGYRCFKAVMFLTGLLFGSIVIFLLCYKEQILETRLSDKASAGIGLAVGLLCGLVTMLLRSVGLFMTGLLLGLQVAAAGLIVAEQFVHLPSAWVTVGALLGTGVLTALLALHWQRAITILATAVFGAAILTVAVDYFVEDLHLITYVYNRLCVVPTSQLCWYSWAVLAVWPVLVMLGLVTQWKLTADGYSHTEVIVSHRQKRVPLRRLRQQDAHKERNCSSSNAMYRRKPGAVKRCDGDVLSPEGNRSMDAFLTRWSSSVWRGYHVTLLRIWKL